MFHIQPLIPSFVRRDFFPWKLSDSQRCPSNLKDPLQFCISTNPNTIKQPKEESSPSVLSLQHRRQRELFPATLQVSFCHPNLGLMRLKLSKTISNTVWVQIALAAIGVTIVLLVIHNRDIYRPSWHGPILTIHCTRSFHRQVSSPHPFFCTVEKHYFQKTQALQK